jgi:hypothetical protein
MPISDYDYGSHRLLNEANEDAADVCDGCGSLGIYPSGFCKFCERRLPSCPLCGKKVGPGDIGILALGLPGIVHEGCAVKRERGEQRGTP